MAARRILVVEDEAKIRELLRAYLEAEGAGYEGRGGRTERTLHGVVSPSWGFGESRVVATPPTLGEGCVGTVVPV